MLPRVQRILSVLMSFALLAPALFKPESRLAPEEIAHVGFRDQALSLPPGARTGPGVNTVRFRWVRGWRRHQPHLLKTNGHQNLPHWETQKKSKVISPIVARENDLP